VKTAARRSVEEEKEKKRRKVKGEERRRKESIINIDLYMEWIINRYNLLFNNN
jgi:hypothetical protein